MNLSSLLSNLNYGTILFLMLIESTVIPFPSEVVVAPAAYHAAAGYQNVFLVVLFATIGADLGAEKFLDIKCQLANLKPNVIVINSTIRSIKYNAGITKEKIGLEDLDALEKGICNLDAHIKNMQKYTKNILVCLNRFTTDTDLEIAYVKKHCQELGCKFQVSTSYVNGGKGAIEVAKEIINLCNNQVDFKPLYSFDETIINKINIIAKEIYHAKEVVYSCDVEDKIK